MYELSDDDKRKIREEEEAAAERERYRAFVRQQMAAPAERPLPPLPDEPKVEYYIPWARYLTFFVVVVAVFVFVVAAVDSQRNRVSADEPDRKTVGMTGAPAARQPVARIRREPHLIPFVDQQAFVKAGSYVWYTLKVDEGMESAKLIGKFVTSGGSGNDVQVVVAEPDQFQNWANGHAASLIWSTPGKVTAGSLDLRLKPGTYNLGFSNKFSAFSDKYVTIEAKLFYETVSTVVD